jgi:hypothetical protein
MNIVDQALENQLKNIQSRTGKTLEELYAIIRASGLTRHGEIRDMLKRELGLGHGDATQLTAVHLKSLQAAPGADADPVETALAEIYSGSKAGLRQLHDHVMAAIRTLGELEVAPQYEKYPRDGSLRSFAARRHVPVQGVYYCPIRGGYRIDDLDKNGIRCSRLKVKRKINAQ